MDNAQALVVGIANYQKINKLPATILKDAQDIYKLLTAPAYCGYSPDRSQLLLDEQATKVGIVEALAKLAERSNDNSTVFIYISSHGGQIKAGPHKGEYLLPIDTDLTNDLSSDAALAHTSISGEQFTEALRAIPARKLVVMFDCCHAGGIGQPKEGIAQAIEKGLPENYYEILTQGRGRVILASSRGHEQSYILPGAENSLFTQHLLAGLRGEAIGTGGVIRILDLFSYLQPKVTNDCSTQHPILKAEIEENFPVSLHLGGRKETPIPTASLADNYEYDAFISYQAKGPDKTWVHQTLLPSLESSGLKVCLDVRFPLGIPIITSLERAIQRSHYTLLVLSPAYLESSYVEFENLVAQHLGLEESRYRLLPILRAECTPRLGLRVLPLLDMSDSESFEMNIDRLIYQLRQPPSGKDG